MAAILLPAMPRAQRNTVLCVAEIYFLESTMCLIRVDFS